jgi:hypothetical protein
MIKQELYITLRFNLATHKVCLGDAGKTCRYLKQKILRDLVIYQPAGLTITLSWGLVIMV